MDGSRPLQFFIRTMTPCARSGSDATGGDSEMWGGCEECQRLWREYAAATTAHIRLQGKLQVATIQHDLENIARLEAETGTAEKVRGDLREAIRRHEENSHGAGPGT